MFLKIFGLIHSWVETKTMLDTKIYTDKSLKQVKCDNLNIPIINQENAILYKHKDDDYTKRFNIPTIYSGLTFYEGKYFYFEHNIVQTPNFWCSSPNSVHAYDIHQITKDLGEDMIKSKKAFRWKIRFNSLFNFGEYFTSIRRGSYLETYKYESRKSDGELIIPYSTSPSGIKPGITIGDFLKNHTKEYPNGYTELTINRGTLRDILISEILD